MGKKQVENGLLPVQWLVLKNKCLTEDGVRKGSLLDDFRNAKTLYQIVTQLRRALPMISDKKRVIMILYSGRDTE